MLNKQRKYMPEYVPELLKIKREQKRVKMFLMVDL